ncbi:TPA: DUF2635 domain-containing protein [Klebsiella variicola subsp. variicola]|nr:DUF2635 domain-containing protein [Klebsiella variicola subsp. variicola]
MKKHIKPAREGLKVRKPGGEHLNPEGEALLMNAWWHRRAAEGDVIIADIPAAPSQTRAVKEK